MTAAVLEEPMSLVTVATLFSGTLDLAEDRILSFTQPLLGFERHDRWITYQSIDGPLHWLQAVDDPRATFCILSPSEAGMAADWEIGRDDATDLGTTDARELELYTVVVLDRDPQQIRTNFRAPILVCRRTGRAKQLVIDDPRLPIKQPLSEIAHRALPKAGVIAGARRR
jgi:flagellar assembly factor FliW